MTEVGYFRKRPVVISASRWDGTVGGATVVIDWMLEHDGTARFHDDGEPWFLAIDTLEGTMHALSGDWIIRGVENEFYPCKDSVFALTYEQILS